MPTWTPLRKRWTGGLKNMAYSRPDMGAIQANSPIDNGLKTVDNLPKTVDNLP